MPGLKMHESLKKEVAAVPGDNKEEKLKHIEEEIEKLAPPPVIREIKYGLTEKKPRGSSWGKPFE